MHEINYPGLPIINLIPGSPAARAGIKPGDRLIAVDEQAVNSWDDYFNIINSASTDIRRVDIIRGNKFLTYSLQLDVVEPPNYQEIIG